MRFARDDAGLALAGRGGGGGAADELGTGTGTAIEGVDGTGNEAREREVEMASFVALNHGQSVVL